MKRFFTRRKLIILSTLIIIGVVLYSLDYKAIILKFYGIKQPGVENRETIIETAMKYSLDTTNIVSVNSDAFLAVMKENGIPDAAIYNNAGDFIEYRQTDSTCNAGLFGFIPDLSKDKTYNQPTAPTLTEQLAKFKTLGGNSLPKPADADFYVLLYWTAWSGRLNKDHVKIWEDLAMANKNCMIKVIKVNLDVQQYWDPSAQTEILTSMKDLLTDMGK